MKVKKVFKTEENTILIVTASTDGNNIKDSRQYVSITADEISPIKRSDAVAQVKDYLEDGEMWKYAVEANQTEESLKDWVEMVLSIDELDGFDNSLYPNELDIDGEDYIFASQSCGCLHEAIAKCTDIFRDIIKMHLLDTSRAVKNAEVILKNIKSDNIDKMVKKFTKEIIEDNE